MTFMQRVLRHDTKSMIHKEKKWMATKCKTFVL